MQWSQLDLFLKKSVLKEERNLLLYVLIIFKYILFSRDHFI